MRSYGNDEQSEPGFFGIVGSGMAVYTNSPGRAPMSGGPSGPAPRVSAPATCWAQSDNVFYGVTRAHETLPAGIYRCEWRDSIGPVLASTSVNTDNLITLPDSASASIVDEIRRFRSRRDKFESLGFLHKRGVLLWGPAGSGKTSTIMLLCKLIVGEENGIAVYADHPELTAQCLQLLRRIEPNRPLIVVFEDLDALIQRFGENEYLALLDGESQVNNVVSVATTNYPERLDKRFVDRPGRFASIRYIGMPSRAAREAYVLAKLPASANGSVEAYIDASEGLSIDHLRELIVLTQCDDVLLDEAAKRMHAMKAAKPNSGRSPEWQGAGFGTSAEA